MQESDLARYSRPCSTMSKMYQVFVLFGKGSGEKLAFGSPGDVAYSGAFSQLLPGSLPAGAT